jgi:beta-lactamase superfamily II metal-dependent hydrolase
MTKIDEKEIVRIYFKNVGQGDCIILEWLNEENEWEIALIDCNKKGRSSNNVVESVQKHISKYKKLRFLLMSHPHYDHFSGLQSILIFCKKEGIMIEEIYHTAFLANDHLEVLLANQKSNENATHLKQLFDTFEDLDTPEGEIGTKVRIIQNPTTLIEVENKNLYISTLSPSTYEVKRYAKAALSKDAQTLKIKKHGGDNNILSTIICIETANWQILLTSDAIKETFEKRLKLAKKPYAVSKNRPLLALQVPHHGSIENHSPSFWDDYIDKSKTVAIISAGQNIMYKHPHEEVVNYFHNKAHKLYSTNNVHGYKAHFGNTQKKANTVLNVVDFDISLDSPVNALPNTANKVINGIDSDWNTTQYHNNCGTQLLKFWADGRNPEVQTLPN